MIKRVFFYCAFSLLLLSCASKSIKPVVDNSTLRAADKSLIDKQIQGKRIVLLGEPDHWINEKGAYQIEIIDYLAKKGFNIVANERSLFDSQNVQNYLATGDERLLSLIGENGYKNPNWPIRTPKGMLLPKDDLQSEYRKRMKKNDYRFYSSLREVYLKNNFFYSGYDVDKIPDIVFDRLQLFIPKLAASSVRECSSIAHLLQRTSEGRLDYELTNLKKFNKLISRCPTKKIFTPSEHLEFSEVLQQSYESISFLAVALNNPSQEQLLIAYKKREQTMLRNALKLLERKENKVILLGHNAHLSRFESEYSRVLEVNGKKIEVPNWKSLGSFLNDSFKNDILIVWMLTENGTHSASFCEREIPCKFQSFTDTVESYLGKKTQKAFDTCSSLLNGLGEENFKWMENGIIKIAGNLCRTSDIIYFKKYSTGI